MKRQVALYGQATDPVHRWIKTVGWKHLTEEVTTTESMRRYVASGFTRGRDYLDFTVYDLHNSVEQVQLFRMRTGSYLTAQRLAQMKIISPDYHGKCQLCGRLVPETFQHLLISCSAWADIRLEAFASNFERVFEMDEASASVLLLGGEIRGENGPIVEGFIQGITLATIDFLQSISTQRLRVLQNLRLALKIGVLRQCGYTMPPNYFGIDFILPMTIKRNGENPNDDDIFSFIAVQSKSTKQDLVECTFKMSGLFHLNRCPNTNHLNESHCTASNCKAYIKMSDMITILEDQVVILLTASSPKARSSTTTVCLKGRQSKTLEKKKEEAENAKLASLKGNKSNMNNVSASGTKKSEPRVKKAKISQQPDEIVEDAFNSFNAEMLAFVPDMDRKNVISVNFPNYFSANKIRFDLQPECIITKNISDTVTLQKMIWDYSEDQIEFLLSDNSSKKGKKGKKEDVNADVDVNFDMDLDANEDVDAKVNVKTEELKGKDTQNHLKHISVTCIAVNDISFFQHLVGKNGISVTREIIDFSLSNFQNVDELHKPIGQNSMLNGVFSPYCTINPTM